jgi:hypothetical protein
LVGFLSRGGEFKSLDEDEKVTYEVTQGRKGMQRRKTSPRLKLLFYADRRGSGSKRSLGLRPFATIPL